MPSPRVLILRAAGTNCDEELAFAFTRAGARSERVHVNRLLDGSRKLSDFDILGIPGGFTYGDDIAAGRVLGNELTTRLRDALFAFVDAGKPVIGICNGFQVLVNTRLLPGQDADGRERTATLTYNDSGRFEDRWTYLNVSGERCLWTAGMRGRIVHFPVAHGEGKFMPVSDSVLDSLEADGQIVFRYVNADGSNPEYPANPNGSARDIAGICNRAGNVLGLMPHPERHVLDTQHPSWTRRNPDHANEDGDGMALFRNAVDYVK